MKRKLRLGVNVDHVATIRNARSGVYPDPVRAAQLAAAAGADGITAHLREDRRHIRDEDIRRICKEVEKPLNFEMAATTEMLEIALRNKPHAVCIVPEKREEQTTEGGLDAVGGHNHLQPFVRQMSEVGIRVSLFIEPEPIQLDAAVAVGAPVVELHTGTYAELESSAQVAEFVRIKSAAAYAESIGLECHAGHGLTYDNVAPVASINNIVELNIGHFLIGEAIFSGLDRAIRHMRSLMDRARADAEGARST